MARSTLKTTIASIAVAGILAATLAPGTAHAARSHNGAPTTVSVAVQLVVANPDEAKDCHHLDVQFNGGQPVVLYCKDKHQTNSQSTAPAASLRSRLPGMLVSQLRPAGMPAVRPHIVADPQCGTDVIHLWADAGEQGDSLCIAGNTTPGVYLNLTDVPHGWGGIYGTWNDIASSWAINKSTCRGAFFADINGGGAMQGFAYPSHGNFDGTTGHLNNDSLSSVGQTSGC